LAFYNLQYIKINVPKGIEKRMTRTAAREIAVRLCFAANESGMVPEDVLEDVLDEEYYATLATEDEVFENYPDGKQMEYICELVKGVINHQKELMTYIERYATGWKIDRISKTALAIMSVAMYEILFMSDIPDNASINEAIELAKKYEEPETVPFINGILGSFYRSEASQI
jgi:N utilization substance protein B